MSRILLLTVLLWAGFTAAVWAQTNSACVDTSGCALDDTNVFYPANPLTYPMISDQYAVQYKLGNGGWSNVPVHFSYYGGTLAPIFLKKFRLFPWFEGYISVECHAGVHKGSGLPIAGEIALDRDIGGKMKWLKGKSFAQLLTIKLEGVQEAQVLVCKIKLEEIVTQTFHTQNTHGS
jgi:hypothetical protein